MKRIFFPVVILIAIFGGTLAAQEADNSADEGAVPKVIDTVTDAGNLGTALLDQAIEAKLRVNAVSDLNRVILLCQQAKGEGLSGEDLRYCNQLLASAQLQRGLFFAQQLINPANVRPDDWLTFRQRTLIDLEEAVVFIKDQPTAYLRIGQLNLMPDGDVDRAKEALVLAIQNANDALHVQISAIRLLVGIEPDPTKREVILSDAAKNGNPQIVMLRILALLELDRRDEATDILKKLVEAGRGKPETYEPIVMVLTEIREYELALGVLDIIREEADNNRKNQIDLMKAKIFNDMERYEDALTLLNSLSERIQGNNDPTIMLLFLRSIAHLALDNFDDALKDIETAEQARSNDPLILEQKYLILVAQENYTDAIAVVKKLQTVDEQLLNFFREIHALIELGKYDEAAGAVQALQKKYPDNEQQSLEILVKIYSKQKAYDKALALVEEQLAKNPEDLRWILAKTGLYSEQKQWNEAIGWLESQIQREGVDARTLNLALIEVFYERKSYRAARDRLRPFLEKEPDDLRFLRWDSQLAISLGQHADAISALTKVIEAEPSDYTSVNNLAWILATSPIDSVRDGRRAVELAEKAGELSRHKRAFVLSTLAAAYAEVGNFEKAREWAVISVDVAKTERGKTEEERKELLADLQKEWDAFSQDMPFRELLNEEGEQGE